ncbi:MAG: hypothetical protein NC205_02550 [Prevotella sp.]|nr:hypothetical protein [Alistipes senegalensis]MCM1357448.1 hypothetical protein [Prevotella sp.]MCM1473255.1 hypothetical protein [Muribaculaceae bacterium]
MYTKSKIMLGCVVLAGVICTSSFLSYAQNDDTAVTGTAAENPDYEEMLAPYENVFNEFNNSHGTNYGFMTDEQLERFGKSREEYQKEMVEEYASMTPEEFEQFLDETYSEDQKFLSEMEAYSKEQKLSPENLPYYQKEESEIEKETICVSIKDNSYGVHYLKD